MALTVRMGIRVRAPREFVFQHLLTPFHLARWFCNFVQFDLRGPAVGTKFRFGGDYAIAAADPPGWPCEILSGEVLRSVAFAWPLFDADTRVEWRVEEAPEGCVFRVLHTGLPREDSTCGTFHDAWRICLGNLKAIAEARGDSLRPDSTPIREPKIRLDLLVDATPSKVFAALVEPATLRTWTEAERAPVVEPRLGGAYGFGWPSDGDGTIASYEPANVLSVVWPSNSGRTRGTFTLEEKGGNRTGLYFLHEGGPVDNPASAIRLRCRWSGLLVGLKNLLEAGETGFTQPYGREVEVR